MKEKITLKGITWGHSRGITPLLAYAQRFSELHPHVEVHWKKRSLQEFADFPIEQLTAQYDLLIIDHPWVGCAAATQCVLPLERHLPETYIKDQEKNSVGGSHQSYTYNGHQWALAIDAATPAASYRADLLQLHKIAVPSTWEEVIALAKEGKVAVPAIPIDLLMNFYTFCLAHGNEPFQSEVEVIDTETGLQALHTMKELYSLVDKKMFGYNPIAVAEAMTKGDAFWYCPFAYGYSNYSRKGYAKHLLHYSDVVSFKGEKLRTTVGGTGIAVSAHSPQKDWALRFAKEVVSPEIQATFYVQHGGQPGHLSAWKDEAANQLCQNYFTNVLPAMVRGYIRPRYNGYLHFQDQAGDPIRRYLWHGGQPSRVLEELNKMYRHSRSRKPAKAAV